MTVLLINHKQVRCGVHQFGKRVFNIIKQSDKVRFIYGEASSLEECKILINSVQPTHIIYNWHHYVMGWLTEEFIIERPSIKNYFIFHDGIMRTNYTKYLFFADYDLNRDLVPPEKRVLLPRPLFCYDGEYRQNNTFTIGTFGFAFRQKGLPRLIKEVNNTFDSAIINLQVSQTFFTDSSDIYKECQMIRRKPKIKLNISSEFLDDYGILRFLAGNDINVFFYYDNGEGLSSATDYALSVKRPIAVTDCSMFRHFKYDDILLDKHNIKEIYDISIANTLSPLDSLYNEWHPNRFLKSIEEFFTNE